MYADRYSRQNALKPGSLALAMALTALPIAGLVMSTGMTRIIEHATTLTLQPIEAPKPPPPPPQPRPRPETKAPVEKVYIPPIKPVALPRVDPIDFTNLKPEPQPSTPPDIGTGEAGTKPTPIPTPVVVDSIYDQRYVNALQPPYPPGEIRAGNEGRVVLRVLIGTDGRVKQVERVSATSDAFFAAAERQALTRWRFKPATRDGVAVEQWKQMSLRFTLTDNG